METILCEHVETVEKVPGTDLQVAQCSLCGQTRKFKDSDEYSLVITKLGRIDGKIVMPKAGQKLELSPEESRLVREGWELLGALSAPKGPVRGGRAPAAEEQAEVPTEVVAEEEAQVKAQRMGRPRKYDRNRQEILVDYGLMTVTDLIRKHDIPKGSFYGLKNRWEAQGIVFPAAYADRQATIRIPTVGDKRRKTSGLQLAFRGFIKEDIDLSQEQVNALLAKYLEKEPAATVMFLFGTNQAFTIEQIFQKALELYVCEIMEQSEDFEKVGDGEYKLIKDQD